MNSQKQLYEELIKEHPELKESKVDIQEVITLMQEINPEIVVDEEYKSLLKNRLDTIAQYNPQKSSGILWFLKYFVPVFSFGFAVFWFIYFSEDFNSEKKLEQNSDIESIQINFTELWTEDLNDIDSSNIQNISEKSNSVIYWRESNAESTLLSDDLPISQDIESSSMMRINTFSEQKINSFEENCAEYDGLFKIMEDADKVCILENKNCYESDYLENNCFETINVTNEE